MKDSLKVFSAIVVLLIFGIMPSTYAGDGVVEVSGELICLTMKDRGESRIFEDAYIKNGSRDIFAYAPGDYNAPDSFDIVARAWDKAAKSAGTYKIQVTFRGVRVTRDNLDKYPFLKNRFDDKAERYILKELTIGDSTIKF